MGVVDRGRRTHPRLASPSRDGGSGGGGGGGHAQESGAGPSRDLAPTAPSSSRYSRDGTTQQQQQSRLTVVDLASEAGVRRDGYSPPTQRAHAPHHDQQLFVRGRHPDGHVRVDGVDSLQRRRPSPRMAEKTYHESADSSIAIHVRDAAAAATTSGGGGGGGGGSGTPELKMAFSA